MENISPAEWKIMRVVWTLHRVNAQDIIDNIIPKTWQEPTIRTFIGRLVKKGFLKVDKKKHPFIYEATVSESAMIDVSVTDLFDSLCAHKKGTAILELLKTTILSQNDILKLEQALIEKKQTAPIEVACNCLKEGTCDANE